MWQSAVQLLGRLSPKDSMHVMLSMLRRLHHSPHHVQRPLLDFLQTLRPIELSTVASQLVQRAASDESEVQQAAIALLRKLPREELTKLEPKLRAHIQGK